MMSWSVVGDTISQIRRRNLNHCTIDEAKHANCTLAGNRFESIFLSCILHQDRLEGHQRWITFLGWFFYCLACQLFIHIVSCCDSISP